MLTFFFTTRATLLLSFLQLLAMDVSAQVTMKDAAKCDKRCEWQNSANQENAERKLHFQVIPESMSVSGHPYYYVISISASLERQRAVGVFVCQRSEIRCHIKFRSFRLGALPLGVFSLLARSVASYIGYSFFEAFCLCSCMKSDKVTR